jgi:hypothetical protein
MTLNWNSVRAEHVQQACQRLSAARAARPPTGIVVWYEEQPLRAKEVLRIAYRLANRLPETADLRFSSGDATLRFLNQLGFKVERLGPARTMGRSPPNTSA